MEEEQVVEFVSIAWAMPFSSIFSKMLNLDVPGPFRSYKAQQSNLMEHMTLSH